MDENSFWDNFLANLKVAVRQFSSYVIIAAGVALQALVGDPAVSAKIAGWLGNISFLTWMVPYTGFVVMILGALAKAWPQVSVTKQVLKNAEASADVKVVDAEQAKDAGLKSVAGKV
jgi:hypothetical protein